MPVYKDHERGTWYISLSYSPSKGVYKKKTKRGFKKKKDAQKFESILMLELSENTANTSLILDDIWKEYTDYMEAIHWKASTINQKKSIYKTHIQLRFGKQNILHIQKKDLADWQSDLVKAGYKKGTINGIHSTLSGLYTYANNIYDINYSPLSKVGYIKSNKESKDTFNIIEKNDFVAFIQANEEYQYKLLFRLLYSTGLRIGELKGLKWTDWKKQSLKIHKNNSVLGNGTTKTPKSFRIVPIDEELNRLLKTWKDMCSKEDTYDPKGYIFFYKTNTHPLTDYLINKELQTILEKCGLKRMTAHDFRHTYVSLLIDAGYDDTAIAELIGDEVSTVRSVYAHMFPKRRKEVATFLGNFIPKIDFEQESQKILS